jgi:hypothetical protein
MRGKMKGKILKLSISIISAALLLSFILAGCASFRSEVAEEMGVEAGGQDMSRDYAEAEVEMAGQEGAPATTMAEAPEEGVVSSESELYTQAGSADIATAQAISTKLIKNASIQIEVKKGEFERKFFEVASLAEQNNGYVSNSQSYSDSEGKMTSGVITIRIDKKNFDLVLSKLKEMGTVLNVSINVQDVTQEYVDNESRLKNLEAQQKRLLALMDQSVTVKDSIEVQRELSNVEGQIEVIKGRQTYLDNLVAYSTIDVYISEPQPLTEPSEGGFIGAIKRGARGALTVLRGLTMVLIAMSPVLVIVAIILIIIWQSLRARNRRRARAKLEQGQQSKQ